MSKPRVSTSALVASAVAIAVAAVLAACGGGARAHTSPATAGTPTDTSAATAGARTHTRPATASRRTQSPPRVVVAISSRRSGHSLPAAFVGLAMEDWTLTKNQFAHTNLRRYLLTLGPRDRKSVV